jgi:site-specific DNA recombinase
MGLGQVLQQFIRSDSEVSGATLNQRNGLNSLIEDAKRLPRPFDCLLIDDTSRLGRNLTDVLKVSDILKHYGVFLYFVSQQFDSRDRSFRQLLIMNGMVDEQFLVGLAEKVHRGQEGRILKGQVAGGRCFGYRNVPIEDFAHLGEYGRPAILGVKQEINEAEADTIRRMFDLYGDRNSLATISKKFNGEKIPAPRPRRGGLRAWSPNAIHSMLRNEKYRGRVVWNKSRSVRNPETGIKQGVPRPEDEWVIVDVPDLRIVSEQQWERVQAVIKRNSEIYGTQRLGGLNRTANCRDYLFSGLLMCSLCGSKMVICSGTGKNARYGCPAHRYKGVCPNGLQIMHERLEHQMLKYLVDSVFRPDMLEHTILEFQDRIKRSSDLFFESQMRVQAELPKLKTELRKLEIEARNLGTAIAEYGIRRSPTLLAQLTFVEDRIERIDRQIHEVQPEPPKVPTERVREFVLERAAELETILLGDRAAAKQALLTHFRPLVLAPKQTPDGPVFTVEGNLDLFSGLPDVMLLAAPQRIELCSAD